MSEKTQNLAEAISEAQKIIEAAEERALELTQGAKDAQREGYDSGYEQGYQAGLQQGKKEALDKAVRMLEDSGAIGSSLAAQVAHLSIQIAKTILGEQIASKPDTVLEVAKKAIKESVIGESACLVVNPSEKELVLEISSELEKIAGGAGIKVETDERINKGGCVVRSDFGEVDARIENLLEVIATRLGINPEGA